MPLALRLRRQPRVRKSRIDGRGIACRVAAEGASVRNAAESYDVVHADVDIGIGVLADHSDGAGDVSSSQGGQVLPVQGHHPGRGFHSAAHQM